eukprot:m.88691 g.88691  ORF g.88691 m.88691 type:complete len:647 (+) comp8814_c0_seq1:340-2280(+)
MELSWYYGRRRSRSSKRSSLVRLFLPFVLVVMLLGYDMVVLPTASLDLPFIPSYKQAQAYVKLKVRNTKTLIILNSDCDISKNLTTTIFQTWGSSFGSDLFTIKIVVGNSAKKGYCSMHCGGHAQLPCESEEVRAQENHILYLPHCPDEYPPVKKVLCMWDFVLRKWRTKFDYYMKIDMDTYLNIPNLLLFLQDNPPNKPLYAGRVGTGRTEAIEPFCLGMAYILSKESFSALPINSFSTSPMLANSDVTFSTVIRKYLKLTCMDGVSSSYKWTFVNRYWDFHNGAFATLSFNDAMQSILPLSHVTSSQLQASSIHPIKTTKDMLTLHNIVSRSQLPLVQYTNPKGRTRMPEEMEPLCVYNPSQQYARAGFYMRECARERPIHPKKVTHAYVVYLPNRKSSAERAEEIVSQLKGFGFNANYHEGIDGAEVFESHPGGTLSVAEIGLREAYRTLFYSIIHSPEAQNDGLYLIVEDDVTFSPHFMSRLDNLLQDPYCGSFLSSNSGGALLLGATIWSNGSFPLINKWPGGWNLVNFNLHKNRYPRCYNFNPGVYGTYAQVLDLRAIQLFITWLNDPQYAHRPIDHAYNYLAERGLPVQVAFPYIALPRGDTSSMHAYNRVAVEERRKLHKWYFEEERESEKHLSKMGL